MKRELWEPDENGETFGMRLVRLQKQWQENPPPPLPTAIGIAANQQLVIEALRQEGMSVGEILRLFEGESGE